MILKKFYFLFLKFLTINTNEQAYPTNHKYLYNFQVSLEPDGSLLLTNPKGISSKSHTFLCSKSIFLKVNYPQTCLELFLKWNVNFDGWQIIYPDDISPVNTFCNNSKLTDGTKAM